MDARKRRIAENESHFREINERLGDDIRRVRGDVDSPVDFVCECGHVSCSAAVPVTLGGYERIRANPRLFAVVPGHEIGDVEEVVERRGSSLVLRKLAEAGDIYEATDPRA
jgi:hypothetical protein